MKCSSNLYLWKKWPIKIYKFFPECPDFLGLLIKPPSLRLQKVGRSVTYEVVDKLLKLPFLLTTINLTLSRGD